MLTDPVAILQEIIEQDGDCSHFAMPAVCKRCPLGGKKIDGRRVRCGDYVHSIRSFDGKSYEERHEIFKTVAEEELFTIELEKLLE